MEMTKEEREISAELSRQGYFVKDKSNPTNVFILKQKATMRPERIDEIMLTDKEQQAVEMLKDCGWQVIVGAHLEDWNEGQIIKTKYRDDESLEVRSEIAIIKVTI